MKYIKPIIAMIILVAIDQLTKYIITANYAIGGGFSVIKDVFEIRYLRNEGAAWGMLQGKRVIFLIITAIVLIFGAYVYYKLINTDKHYNAIKVLLVFFLSGAIGNMIDRLLNGYVVDFLYIKLINFPIFNVADCYVTMSLIVLIILLFTVYKHDDLESMVFGKEDD